MSKIIYVDLDDTIANFSGHPVFAKTGVDEFTVNAMYEPGFFLSLRPVEGAVSGVRALMRLGYDVHILTQPLAESSHSYMEKVQWIGLHFPELINKVHMTQNKGLFRGDYLIDDNAKKWKEKFEANGGKFIEFNIKDPNHKAVWAEIVEYMQHVAAT